MVSFTHGWADNLYADHHGNLLIHHLVKLFPYCMSELALRNANKGEGEDEWEQFISLYLLPILIVSFPHQYSFITLYSGSLLSGFFPLFQLHHLLDVTGNNTNLLPIGLLLAMIIRWLLHSILKITLWGLPCFDRLFTPSPDYSLPPLDRTLPRNHSNASIYSNTSINNGWGHGVIKWNS